MAPTTNPHDYTVAIDSPSACFLDAQLASGSVERNAFGHPQPITGNFANIYKINGSGRDWAVKCFLADVSDRGDRYAAIQKHFANNCTENTIGFEFIQQGIKVKGNWCPIVKMDWLHGETLDTFIANNLHSPPILVWLADQFKQMHKRLNKAGIAHGDLHHGNIIVTKGGVKLVDYDGAFVPALAELKSNELGHHNYQHPMRIVNDFAPHIDNFSAWVIHTSLFCLGQDPKLWHSLAGGDECLLFRSSDFGNAVASYAFSLLENHDSEEIRYAARTLRTFCDVPLDKVPLVGEPLERFAPLPPLRASISLPRWIPKSQQTIESQPGRPFPGFRHFNEAMRTPAQTFEDVELKEGICLLEDTKVGENGRVYRFVCTERDVAVKCFSADHPERADRYKEIGRAPKGAAAPFLVGCEYVERGIYLHGEWYPILKMPWVSGCQVAEIPPVRLTHAVCSYIADQFAVMMKAFRQSGIGHGDLEFANLIFDLDANELKVVDYDNMFVPALTRMGSMELGHPGFQSPRRQPADYGPYVDNFSAWLIHYMLQNLAINRHLDEWVESCFEEERKGSTAHAILRAMENDRECEVRNLGKLVRALLARPLHVLPDFDDEKSWEHVLTTQSKEVSKTSGLLKKRLQ